MAEVPIFLLAVSRGLLAAAVEPPTILYHLAPSISPLTFGICSLRAQSLLRAPLIKSGPRRRISPPYSQLI